MIDDVKDRHESKLLSVDGVTGVGIGKSEKGTLCIKIYVKKKAAEIDKSLPKKIEGFDVEIEEVGEVIAL